MSHCISQDISQAMSQAMSQNMSICLKTCLYVSKCFLKHIPLCIFIYVSIHISLNSWACGFRWFKPCTRDLYFYDSLIKLTSLGTSHAVLIDLSVSLLTDALPHQVHVLMGANSVFPQTVLMIHARSQTWTWGFMSNI